MVEILSHKKAYNTCEGLLAGEPRGWGWGEDTTPWGHRASDSPQWMVEIGLWGAQHLPPGCVNAPSQVRVLALALPPSCDLLPVLALPPATSSAKPL